MGIKKSILKSPKTTIAGIIIGLCILFPEVKAYVQGEEVYMNLVAAGLAALFGGAIARDADKSSEDHK